jgi:uncharacterized protein
MIITKNQWDYIRRQQFGKTFSLEVDFGIRQIEAKKNKKSVVLAGSSAVSLDQKVKENFCYLVKKKELIPISFFSDKTKKLYKLVPSQDWPTISISSVPMHNLFSPRQDSQAKIKLLRPFGYVLDSCMGLGYTAILAADLSERVDTFEKDENVYGVAKINPLSKGLFNQDNITIYRKDIFEYIENFKSLYDCIIHDPPTFKLAPGLFSREFYFKLKAALKKGGKLFHYTPLYKIKRGYNFPAKIKGKLKKAGFNNISFNSQVCGIICKK